MVWWRSFLCKPLICWIDSRHFPEMLMNTTNSLLLEYPPLWVSGEANSLWLEWSPLVKGEKCFQVVLLSFCQRCIHTTFNMNIDQSPVVQSIVSLTSSLRVISLTVLADSIHNILIFFAGKMWVAFALQKLLTFFQQKISEYLCITRCKF